MVMWAGIGIAKDTLEPLIGEAIDPEVYGKIKKFVESYDGIAVSYTHLDVYKRQAPGRP